MPLHTYKNAEAAEPVDLIGGWYKCETLEPPWKAVWKFLIKRNPHLSFNPTSKHLPEWNGNYVQIKTCMRRFIVALFPHLRNYPNVFQLVNVQIYWVCPYSGYC